MGLVRMHSELNIIVFGVIQSSIFRRQHVPKNSVDLRCFYEAVEVSELPKTLMELVEIAPCQTFLDDLLNLSYNLAIVSDRSGNDIL